MAQKQFFVDASIQGPGADPTFCYRSGMAVFEETLQDSVLCASGCNAAGYPLNVLSNFPSRIGMGRTSNPSVFALELDGESMEYGWSFVAFDKTTESNGSLHTTLKLYNERKSIELVEHTLLDGTQMMSRWFTLTNKSAGAVRINRLGLYNGCLEEGDTADHAQTADLAPREIYEVGYFDNDSWGREGEFAWHPLHKDGMFVDCRFNRDRYRHPMLMIRNKFWGKIYFMQLAWSGGCRFTVDVNAQDGRHDATLSLCAELTGYHPLYVIAPGETFETPAVLFGLLQGDLDMAVQEMHAHVRKSVLNRPEANGDACLVGAGMGAEHDMSMETTRAFMKHMAEMGGEVFIIDAGWCCPPGTEASEWGAMNGILEPNADRYPDNGLAKLREECHALGMKFAMWIEIERLGHKAPIAAEHPEWFAAPMFCDRPTGGAIDLTNPAAYAWAHDELARMIREFGLDLLRVDYNIGIDNTFRKGDRGTGINECLNIRHNQAVYKLYGSLKKEFPNVIFENCAGGGGRTDLGQMAAFNHTWVSDNQHMPRSVEITNGMTMALPPERVDRLFAGMGCHMSGEFQSHLRNTMLTHTSLNVIVPRTAQANPDAMAFIRHSMDLYKSFIRPMLPTSLVWHHTPTRADTQKLGYSALEISAPDGTSDALAVFATPTCTERRDVVILPRGLHADLTYAVTLDNSGSTYTATGAQLLQNGVRIVLPSALCSELILFKAQ